MLGVGWCHVPVLYDPMPGIGWCHVTVLHDRMPGIGWCKSQACWNLALRSDGTDGKCMQALPMHACMLGCCGAAAHTGDSCRLSESCVHAGLSVRRIYHS